MCDFSCYCQCVGWMDGYHFRVERNLHRASACRNGSQLSCFVNRLVYIPHTQHCARAFCHLAFSRCYRTMGGKLSAFSMVSRRGRDDEFFFDTFRQKWRWHWEHTWWTFEPLCDDDPEFGIL